MKQSQSKSGFPDFRAGRFGSPFRDKGQNNAVHDGEERMNGVSEPCGHQSEAFIEQVLVQPDVARKDEKNEQYPCQAP